MKLGYIVFLLCAFSFLFSQEKLEEGFYTEQILSGSVNPLGIMLDSKFYYEIPLSKSEDILFKTTKVDAGLINKFTPADDSIGIFLFIEPIAFFDLTLTGMFQYTFDALGYGFLKVDGPQADYSPEVQEKIKPENKSGWWFIAEPRLKVQFGNFIALHTFSFNYMEKLDYYGYYVEPHYDLIMKEKGSFIINDSYAMYQLNKTLMVGINYYNLFVLDTKYSSQKIAGLLAWEPEVQFVSSFFAALLVGSYLEDHYYKGQFFVAIQAGIKERIF